MLAAVAASQRLRAHRRLVPWTRGDAATIADTTAPEMRGRAMGLNLSLCALASVTTHLLGDF